MPGIHATIAGLTYMDNMDFRERYRNVHECDPFYYHPLHLPEYCADMFEKLIRSRIGSRGALSVIKERNYSPKERTRYNYPEDIDAHVEYRELTPYEEMFFSLNKDVEYNPSNAEVTWSNLGPVAVYRQAISRTGKDGIYEFMKKMMPKQRNGGSKKNDLKMDFTYGRNKIKLDVDRENDMYVIYEV